MKFGIKVHHASANRCTHIIQITVAYVSSDIQTHVNNRACGHTTYFPQLTLSRVLAESGHLCSSAVTTSSPACVSVA